jgi:hypothetical protein
MREAVVLQHLLVRVAPAPLAIAATVEVTEELDQKGLETLWLFSNWRKSIVT